MDLSSFYLDVLKDRLYAEHPNGPDRRAAQFVLARLHDALARLIAPILPHTAEELWAFVPDAPDKPESVHLAFLPQPDPAFAAPEGDEIDWTLDDRHPRGRLPRTGEASAPPSPSAATRRRSSPSAATTPPSWSP